MPVFQLSAGQLLDSQDFEPQVSASCNASTMTILVRTQKPFFGVIHGKDIRTDRCIQFGEGGRETRMRINLLAAEGDEDYCGVRGNNVSVVPKQLLLSALKVRSHRHLYDFLLQIISV